MPPKWGKNFDPPPPARRRVSILLQGPPLPAALPGRGREVRMAPEDALPVGVGCCLRDAVRDTDKSENDTDIRREGHD